MGHGSVVNIMTVRGLDGPRIKPQWGEIFRPVQTFPGVRPASCTVDIRPFIGVKQLGHGVDHPPLSSAKVKGRIEPYICSSSGPSWPVSG